MGLSVNETARKHFARQKLTDEDIQHAAAHPIYVARPDDEIPANELRLGFDPRGRLLELQVLVFDDGNELIIHAMKIRPQYLELLD